MSSYFFQSISVALPRDARRLESAYGNCTERERFVAVDPRSFTGHLELAKDDLAAIRANLEGGSWRWVVIKSYYALFHATNALLVRKLGFFSKDHRCAGIALKRRGLIPEGLYAELGAIYEAFSDIFGFAIMFEARKLGQYDIERWRDIGEGDARMSREFAHRFVSFVEGACA